MRWDKVPDEAFGISNLYRERAPCMEFKVYAVCRIVVNLRTRSTKFDISYFAQIDKSNLLTVRANSAKSEPLSDLLCNRFNESIAIKNAFIAIQIFIATRNCDNILDC